MSSLMAEWVDSGLSEEQTSWSIDYSSYSYDKYHKFWCKLGPREHEKHVYEAVYVGSIPNTEPVYTGMPLVDLM